MLALYSMLCLFGVLLLLVAWLQYERRRASTDLKASLGVEGRRDENEALQNDGPRRLGQGPRRRPVRGGVQGMLHQMNTTAQVAAVAAEGDDEPEEQEQPVAGPSKGSTKKEKHKTQKEENRRAVEASESRKVEKQQKRDELVRKREEEREAERLAQEEIEKKWREEREKKEQEEYEKWKTSFSVSVEGSGEAEIEQESQGLLDEFINYLKTHKVVVLEDLASAFKLRVQDVVNRIKALESMGRISGVLDDRGKFIYVSKEEMIAMARYIQQQGRISVSDLARESNRLVDLNPKKAGLDVDQRVPLELDDQDDDTPADGAGEAPPPPPPQ